MIFMPEMASAILEGRKTVTRRLADGPCKYRVGQEYAVQPGRGKSQIARVLFTSIALQKLDDIDRAEAQREGFKDEEAFCQTWARLHREIVWSTPVYRIEFELVTR